ncbi:MAG: hypothetical protein WC995_13540, partial [Lysobacteraceae bacterium]
MPQLSFTDAEQTLKRKQTRREVFLAEMDRVVPWSTLLALIAPHYPKAGAGRQQDVEIVGHHLGSEILLQGQIVQAADGLQVQAVLDAL